MPKVINRGTKPEPEPEVNETAERLKQMQTELFAQQARSEHERNIHNFTADLVEANSGHWLLQETPPLLELFNSLPDLLPYPSKFKEGMRIMAGIASSGHKDAEAVFAKYHAHYSALHDPDFELGEPGDITMEECMECFMHNLALYKTFLIGERGLEPPQTHTPHTLDQLLKLVEESNPGLHVSAWRGKPSRKDNPHDREKSQDSTKATALLAAMKLGETYSLSDFCGEGKLFENDSYCRRVMRSLVENGQVTKLGDRKSTRYTRTDGAIRTVETPPNLFPKK